MGSARMGVSRQASAVDPNGMSWDVQNLFIADAALMPTSTGVFSSHDDAGGFCALQLLARVSADHRISFVGIRLPQTLMVTAMKEGCLALGLHQSVQLCSLMECRCQPNDYGGGNCVDAHDQACSENSCGSFVA